MWLNSNLQAKYCLIFDPKLNRNFERHSTLLNVNIQRSSKKYNLVLLFSSLNHDLKELWKLCTRVQRVVLTYVQKMLLHLFRSVDAVPSVNVGENTVLRFRYTLKPIKTIEITSLKEKSTANAYSLSTYIWSPLWSRSKPLQTLSWPIFRVDIELWLRSKQDWLCGDPDSSFYPIILPQRRLTHITRHMYTEGQVR